MVKQLSVYLRIFKRNLVLFYATSFELFRVPRCSPNVVCLMRKILYSAIFLVSIKDLTKLDSSLRLASSLNKDDISPECLLDVFSSLGLKLCRWTTNKSNTIEGRWFKVPKCSFQTELSFIHAWLRNKLFGRSWLVHFYTLYFCGPLFIVIIKFNWIWNLKSFKESHSRNIRISATAICCEWYTKLTWSDSIYRYLSLAYLSSVFTTLSFNPKRFAYTTLVGLLLKNF